MGLQGIIQLVSGKVSYGKITAGNTFFQKHRPSGGFIAL